MSAKSKEKKESKENRGVPILVTTNSNDEDQYQVWVYPNNVKTEEVMLLGYSFISSHYYSLEGKILILDDHSYKAGQYILQGH